MKPKTPEANAPMAPMRNHWTGDVVLWCAVPGEDGQVMRWQSVDGRWVAITEGHGASQGAILVLDSSGRCDEVSSYDEAMRLAKIWRRT